MRNLFAIAFLLLCSCVGSAQEHVSTALNAIDAVVDPAYKAAMTGCVAREEAVMDAARRSYKDAYGIELETISSRCRKVRESFEVIRKLDNEAWDLVNAGKVDEAERVYGEMLKAWQQLGGTS